MRDHASKGADKKQKGDETAENREGIPRLQSNTNFLPCSALKRAGRNRISQKKNEGRRKNHGAGGSAGQRHGLEHV